MSTFNFRPSWKEDLVCIGSGGSFVLELSMGIMTAYLPTEDAWRDKAPVWAKDLWPVLHDELQDWCRHNKANFIVDATAVIY